MNNEKTIVELRENKEIKALFDRYGFKDEHGHDLLACVDFHKLVRDADTLCKARAVLADNSNVKFIASNLLQDIESQKELYTIEVMKVCTAVLALADALEGDRV